MKNIKIYQLFNNPGYRFDPWKDAKDVFSIEDYEIVEEFEMERHGADDNDKAILEDLFITYNIHRPDHFKGHSMSVSDVVSIDGTLYYCDRIGWVKLN